MNPKKRLPAPPTSPSAQGKPGRRFGFYIALSILLLVTGAGWGQPNGWKWLTGGKLNGVKFMGIIKHLVRIDTGFAPADQRAGGDGDCNGILTL